MIKGLHKADKHILGWTTVITIAFVIGVLVHVLIFSPYRDRNFVKYVNKSHNYLGVILDKYSMDIPNTTLDVFDSEEMVQSVLEQSLDERKQGIVKELYIQQQKQPNPPDRKSTVQVNDGKDRAGVTDTDVGNTDPMIMGYMDYSPGVIGLKDNPVNIKKGKSLKWSNDCNIYASVAIYCYMVGWNGGEATDAVMDVNMIFGDYSNGQYQTCMWCTERGHRDIYSGYLPLDTGTLMMIIEDKCNEE